MTLPKNRLSSFYARVVDFIVLTISFLILSVATDFSSSSHIIIDLSLYVTVMYFSLRICKRLVFENVKTSGPIISIMLGNISGLISGALSVLTINHFMPGIAESALLVIFSSVLAFFILGTISPMVKSSYKDIIHH